MIILTSASGIWLRAARPFQLCGQNNAPRVTSQTVDTTDDETPSKSYRHCQNHSNRDTQRPNISIHLHIRLIRGEAQNTQQNVRWGCLTLTGIYQSCHSIHLLLSQTNSLSPSLFLSHYSLTLSPDSQKRSNTPSQQFPAFF